MYLYLSVFMISSHLGVIHVTKRIRTRKVKLSVCLLEICWLCSPHNNNNKHLFVIVMVWATQAEIPSKQTLSLTFLLFTGNLLAV